MKLTFFRLSLWYHLTLKLFISVCDVVGGDDDWLSKII